MFSSDQAAETTSSTNDTACAPADETLGQARELGCESRDQEVRSSEEPSSGPLKPSSEDCDVVVTEKSPDLPVEGMSLFLLLPMR